MLNTSLLFVLTLIISVKSYNYCPIKCGKSKHTMCQYKEGGPPECKSFTRGLLSRQTWVLLEALNQIRQDVAIGKLEDFPPAANMMVLYWDEEARDIAQRWADQCDQNVEDVCRTKKDGVRGCQAMLITGSYNATDSYFQLRNMVTYEWREQAKQFNKSSIDYFRSDSKTNEFSQIIWASTNLVGCGYSYQENSTYRLVCNFYPEGNIPGKAIYSKGRPCSRCPSYKCSDVYPALCVPSEADVWNRSGAAPLTYYAFIDNIILIAVAIVIFNICFESV